MYTVKEVCSLTGIPYHTLKYYCNEGILPQIHRDAANRRIFDEKNVGWIQDVLTLRSFQMSIQEMRSFTRLCLEGEATIPERMKMLDERERSIREEQKKLEAALEALQKTRQEYEDILAGKIPYECHLHPESQESDEPLQRPF